MEKLLIYFDGEGHKIFNEAYDALKNYELKKKVHPKTSKSQFGLALIKKQLKKD